jgi:hypothetical protein
MRFLPDSLAKSVNTYRSKKNCSNEVIEKNKTFVYAEVIYFLGYSIIPEDTIVHNHCCENLKS